MRFVWAVVAFVLATVLIGAGIAQRTVFMGPDAQQIKVEVEKPAPFVLMDGEVLRAHPGEQTLLIRGKGEIFAAYGRTADMKAWLSVADYNSVTLDKKGRVRVEAVAAEEKPADAETGAEEGTPTEATPPAETTPPAEGDATTGTEGTAAPGPLDSDLWLDTFSEQDALIADNMQLPDGMSVLIAYDGAKDAPDNIVVSWPLDTSTPLAGPFIVAGGAVLLAGLVMYVLAIRHQRRGRGPLRKGPGPLPVTEPIDIASLPAADREAIEAPPADRAQPGDEKSADETVEEAEVVDEQKGDQGRNAMKSARSPRRRRLLALPALGLVAVLAAGCSADSWPQFGASTPSPSPTPTVIVPENQKPPAVTKPQALRILKNISSTLSEADAAMDADLAKTRLDGAALAARTAEYALRTALPETPVPAAIPSEDVEVVLPQATDAWPRTVLIVAKGKGDSTVAPVILTMSQQDPWSDYKVTNMAAMAADAVIPEVAAPWLGTSPVPDESAFLSVAPKDLAASFADVADSGEKSAFYDSYDELAINLAKANQDSRQQLVQRLAESNSAETSQAAFDVVPSDATPVALTTLESGAIVAVSLIDVQQVTPTNPDAVVKIENNPQAKALTGVSESKTGFETKYIWQLFFAVPAKGSAEQIRLLGFDRSILSEQVIK